MIDRPSPDSFEGRDAFDDQRRRLVAAVARAVAERDYAHLSARRVAAVAGVSDATFHEHFIDGREAVIAAHDAISESFVDSLQRACDSELEWPRKLRAAIGAGLAFASAEPEQAQLLFLDALATDADVASHLLATSNRLASLLGSGRRHCPGGSELPKLTEKALVAAAVALVADRLEKGEAEQLPELQPRLVEMLLSPYVGEDEAARVAAAAG